MSEPPNTTDLPPSSTRRANDVYAACGSLSADGAAAVLAYARTMIDKNRRYPSVLQHVAMWKFVAAINEAAVDVKDIISLHNGKYRREMVPIAAVHRQLQLRGDAATMPLAAFKTRVLEAKISKMLIVERCRDPKNLSPLLIEASAIQGPRGMLHLIERTKISTVRHALEHLTGLLPESARAVVASYARRVHADEVLRDGRPRLITLDPDKFAQRIQEFVDRDGEDVSIAQLYWKLEERGEMTGMDLSSFKARLFGAQRAGRLRVERQEESIRPDTLFWPMNTLQDDDITHYVVRRRSLLPPIPWGPPHPPIIRRLVLHPP